MTVYRLVLPLLFCCMMMSICSAEQESGDADVDLIENAIIVNGLSLTQENPSNADTKDGADIIYDDSLIEDDTAVKTVIKIHPVKKNRSNDSEAIMKDLVKADKKWHYTHYTVKKGDSLWTISKKFSTSHRLIIRANGISKADEIKQGKSILIPNRNGFSYKVKQGDTAASIAKKLKVDQSKVIASNKSGRKILAGSTIFVPDAKAPAAVKGSNALQLSRSAKSNNRNEQSPSESLNQESQKKDNQNSKRITSLAFSWPLQGRITSGFGTRTDPFSKDKRFHNGIDISAETGTPVHAASAGTIIFSGWKDGYGNLVVIKHDNGYISVYGHNSELKKKEGDNVQKGEVVSLSGMTGAVTGAHLHFEIQKYGTPLNPLRFIK